MADVTEEEYAAEVAYQRALGLAHVHTELMQLRLDVLFRPTSRRHAPRVRIKDPETLREGVVSWVLTTSPPGDVPWTAARFLQPHVDAFDPAAPEQPVAGIHHAEAEAA